MPPRLQQKAIHSKNSCKELARESVEPVVSLFHN